MAGATQEELARRLELAEALVRATPDWLYVFDVRAREYRYQNTSVHAFLGYTPEQVASVEAETPFHVWVGHPDEHDDGVRAVEEQRRLGPDDVFTRLFRLRHASGEHRWYSLRVVSFSRDADGSTREVLGLLRDVHDVVQASARLNESERRFRELFDRSPAGTALVDDDGVFHEVNAAMCAFLGREHDELVGSSYDAVLHPDDVRPAREARFRYRADTEGTRRTERRFVRPDGSVRWGRLSVTRVLDHDGPINLVTLEDVTSVKEVEEHLRHAAMHDMLTGLPNRRMLSDHLERALARRLRTGGHLAVMFVDLDGVKTVNDELGHETGDALLVTVAQRLSDSLRACDMVARVGGDEFVVVCPDLGSVDEVAAIAERLLEAARVDLYPPDRGGRALSASASIGVAMAGPAQHDVESLVRTADNAMYEAKRSGRDRWVLAEGRHSTAIFVPHVCAAVQPPDGPVRTTAAAAEVV